MSQILNLQKLKTPDTNPALSLSISSCDSQSCNGDQE
jgi:hypothetical protein